MPGDFEHITEEDLERYALKTLPDHLLDPLETHLLVCEECQDRLEEAEVYIQAVRDAAGQLRREPHRPPGLRLSGLAGALTAPRLIWAAGVVLLVAGITWLWLGRAPSRQGFAAPVAVSLQTLRGPEDSPPAVAPSGLPLLLEADLTGLPRLGGWELRLVDASGRRRGTFAAQADGDRLAVTVAAGLAKGAYWARVYERGKDQLLREYALRIE